MATLASSNPAQQRYSAVAIALHWLIALALAFQLALGFSMPHDTRGFALFQLHKSVGITILLLTVLRLAWRLTHRPPPAVEGGLTGFLARAVHVLLYLFMLGAPLTGWALVSTDPTGIPTLLFKTVPWPHLPLPHALNEPMEKVHGLLAWLGLALIALHILGALRHQFLQRDGLFRRIGPAGSAWASGLLLLAVLGVYFGTGMKIAGDVVASGGYKPEHEHAEAAAPARVPLAAEPSAAASEAAGTAASDAASDAASEAAGPPPVWTLAGGKTLGFSVGNGDAAISGSFSSWSGTIKFDPDHPETADLRITVQLASAGLGDPTQDEMLQSGDFFGTSAHPTAIWRSTSVRQTAPGRYTAQGTLTLKGVSKPQAVTFRLTGTGLKRHVEGSATINRGAFSIGTGEAAASLAPTVALSFSFDATGKAP